MKTEKLTEWEIHLQGCVKCKTVDISRTNTLVNCCAKGAPLVMDFISKRQTLIAKKHTAALKHQFLQMDDGKVYKTTAANVKRETRYK